MSEGTGTLFDVDPTRDLSTQEVQAAHALAPDETRSYDFGMWTAVGAGRVHQLVETVRAVLAAGLPRRVAVWALLGGCARLERDGLVEYSDTAVRESIAAALEQAFTAAGHAPVTDEELNEMCLLLTQRDLSGRVDGFRQVLQGADS